MAALMWIGIALALAGLAWVLWCIVMVVRARRAGLDDAAMRARLQRLVAMNMGALLLSALGLMTLVVGLILT